MKRLFALLAVVGLLASCDIPDTTAQGPQTPLRTTAAPTMDVPSPEEVYPEPRLADFKVALKVLERECFGSAGGLVTYRPQLSYGGPELDPEIEYELVYEVRGGEDGPETRTLNIIGGEYSGGDEDTIGTKTCAGKLRSKLVSIEAV